MYVRNMEIRRRDTPETTILDVAGEIDLYNADVLKQTLSNLAVEAQPRRVLVNLSGVSYVDSSGIGALISGKGALEKKGSVFGLCALAGSVRAVMQMTKLLAFFQVFDSESDAIASWSLLSA